eukprot:15008283-Alexandrium_andersonii.AAC.1
MFRQLSSIAASLHSFKHSCQRCLRGLSTHHGPFITVSRAGTVVQQSQCCTHAAAAAAGLRPPCGRARGARGEAAGGGNGGGANAMTAPPRHLVIRRVHRHRIIVGYEPQQLDVRLVHGAFSH